MSFIMCGGNDTGQLLVSRQSSDRGLQRSLRLLRSNGDFRFSC